MEHLAIFRMSAMGDVAISVPVVTAFSEQYPDVKITYLTRPLFAPMFSHIPNLEVFTPEINGKHSGLSGLYKLYKELMAKGIDGVASKKVDIAILAEGYTQAETEKFYADAQRMTDYMFTISPFDKLKNNFNVYAIAVPSQESGTDVPGKNIFKNTAFNSSFYTFNQERYLTTNSICEIADAASVVPYDQLYILVNTETYGGGGFYNHLNLGTADNDLSEKVYIHEFGHGFVGLADEYYYDWDPTFQEMYNTKIEPWEENITSLVNFESKWKDMVKKKTPIPTPRTPKYKNVVGAFEGGGYTSKGIYSPAQDCRMKSNEPKGFCPVCERAIRKIVDFYTK